RRPGPRWQRVRRPGPLVSTRTTPPPARAPPRPRGGRAGSSRLAKPLQDSGACVRPLRGRLASRLRGVGPAIELRQPGGLPVRVAWAVDARNDLGGEFEPLVLGERAHVLQELAGR